MVKEIRIESDGFTHNTEIFFDGIKQDNIIRFNMAADIDRSGYVILSITRIIPETNVTVLLSLTDTSLELTKEKEE